jgi:O-antigen ligase
MSSRGAAIRRAPPPVLSGRRSVGELWPSLWISIGAVLVSVFAGRAVFYSAAFQERKAQLFVIAVVAAALVLIFARLGPRVLLWWIPLTGVAYPFLRYPSLNPIVTFDRLWVFGLLGVVLLTAGRKLSRRTRATKNALILMIAIFGVQAIASDGLGVNTLSAWTDIYLLPVVVFFAANRLASSPGRIVQLTRMLVVAGVSLAALGIAERIFSFELASRTGGVPRYDAVIHAVRIAGPYPDPEPYALVLIVCLAATLYWMQFSKRYLLGTTAAAMQSTAVAMTFFRAAWIAALAVVVLSLVWRPQQHARAIGLLAILAAIGTLSYVTLERSHIFQERVQNTENIYSRLGAYHQSLDLFQSSPVTGVGIGEYHETAQTALPLLFHGVPAVSYAHSSYLSVLAEQGLIGFIPLVVLTISIWQLVRQFRKRATSTPDVLFAASLMGAAVGYFIMSLTLTMLPYGSSNAFFALLVGMGSARLDSIERDASEIEETQVDGER